MYLSIHAPPLPTFYQRKAPFFFVSYAGFQSGVPTTHFAPLFLQRWRWDPTRWNGWRREHEDSFPLWLSRFSQWHLILWKQPEHLCNKRDALQGKVKVGRLFCEVLESKENPIAIHGCAVEKLRKVSLNLRFPQVLRAHALGGSLNVLTTFTAEIERMFCSFCGVAIALNQSTGKKSRHLQAISFCFAD